MLAAVTHTPLDVIWRMTPQQIVAYIEVMPDLLALFNPFAKKPEKPTTDLSTIAPELRRLGIMK